MSNKLWEKRREVLRKTIKEIRQKAGLTQKELAGKMGKYQSYVSKYESGERRLDYVELIEVLDACSLNINAFHRMYTKKL
ncbi:MAG: helix-turn-helix transcriptional regulator [Thiotrichales bacterium]|nr:helix-turn-helix transcriptional regulator [Thiotrichales bacterium]